MKPNPFPTKNLSHVANNEKANRQHQASNGMKREANSILDCRQKYETTPYAAGESFLR